MILQIPAADFRNDAPLIELGADSLMAVELRTWFLNETEFEVAVLKVLDGSTTTDLCLYAIAEMPKHLLPNIIAAQPLSGSSSEAPTATNGTVTPVLPDSPASSITTLSNEMQLTQAEHPVSQSRHDDEKDSVTIPDVTHRVNLSPAQSGFWFIHLYVEDPTVSNVTIWYSVRGYLDVNKLFHAVQAVAQSHEGLRTCFLPNEDANEQPWLGIMKESKIKWEHRQISSEDEIKLARHEMQQTTYNLGQGETMRLMLLSLNSSSHTLFIGYHHIILDGVGLQIFLKDLEQAYMGRRSPKPNQQYSTFSANQLRTIKEGKLGNSIEYWKREHTKEPPTLSLLPVSKLTTRKPLQTYKTCRAEKRLGLSVSSKIKQVCKGAHVTTSHFYLAAFRVFLARLAGDSEICVGVVDANRDAKSMATVGLFLNMLPVRFKETQSPDFESILRETRDKVYEALKHSNVPFDELLKGMALVLLFEADQPRCDV